MKKQSVLAMVLALGISSNAYAVNPFSDVPKGSWAYGAVAKLAAGLESRESTGTFPGKYPETRYEMAQIVAKALAQGTIGADNRLVREFAQELDLLGARMPLPERPAGSGKTTSSLREGALRPNVEQGKLDGETAPQLRPWFLGTENAKVQFGQTYLAAFGSRAGQPVSGWTAQTEGKTATEDGFTGAALGGTLGSLSLEAQYLKASPQTAPWVPEEDTLWTAGAAYHFGPVSVGGMYLKGGSDSAAEPGASDEGYVINLRYKGAEATKTGSWGLFGNYYDQGGTAYLSRTLNGAYSAFEPQGFTGYMVGGNLTLAKNMVAQVEYYDLQGKGNGQEGQHARTLWSQMVVTF